MKMERSRRLGVQKHRSFNQKIQKSAHKKIPPPIFCVDRVRLERSSVRYTQPRKAFLSTTVGGETEEKGSLHRARSFPLPALLGSLCIHAFLSLAMMMMGQRSRTKKATFGSAFVIRALCFAIGVARLSGASGKCIASDDAIESFFSSQIDSANPPELPTSGSCCQMDVCQIPCPAEVPKPADSFGIGVICVVVLFCCIGIGTVYFVGGKAKNFFVAGRTLPLPVVILTLASQSIDSNALLGNADLSYKFAFSMAPCYRLVSGCLYF